MKVFGFRRFAPLIVIIDIEPLQGDPAFVTPVFDLVAARTMVEMNEEPPIEPTALRAPINGVSIAIGEHCAFFIDELPDLRNRLLRTNETRK
ncbi:MAG: hypothetical protein GX465_04090 [Acidobacteria bacterium]|nr:hypothetical protein [Acidobacteriota bacterium]